MVRNVVILRFDWPIKMDYLCHVTPALLLWMCSCALSRHQINSSSPEKLSALLWHLHSDQMCDSLHLYIYFIPPEKESLER